MKPEPQLVDAVSLLLRPLARLCIEYGLILPNLEEMLKRALVEVAAGEFGVNGESPSDSRVSVLTGVHRKDVKRLRTEQRQGQEQPLELSLAAEVVARWISDVRYLDRQGNPRVLALSGPGAATFEALASGVSKDVRPRVVLDELVRLGAVQLGRDAVTLLGGSFVPRRGLAEKSFYFGRNTHDHLAACVHNLMGRLPAMLENSVYSYELSAASVEKLAALTREEWLAMLQKLVSETAAAEARDTAAGAADRRMNIGIYFYTEDAGAPASHRSPAPAAQPAAPSPRRTRRTSPGKKT